MRKKTAHSTSTTPSASRPGSPRQGGTLDYYFKPPLSVPELRKTRLEGWIRGVC